MTIIWLAYRNLKLFEKSLKLRAKRDYIAIPNHFGIISNPNVKAQWSGWYTTLTDDLSIVESMNQFFPSVFTSEDLDNFPELDYVCETKFSYIQCSIDEVEKLLKNLNVHKSPGPDH